jgi:putative Mg2+ transporter-C (MgtC) family protein
MTWGDFAIRLLLAFILGAAIGSERQWRRTRSVLKTNVLVSLGAAMFVMLSAMIPGTLAVVGANLLLRPMVQWFQQLDEQLITHTKAETRYCCRLICLTEEEAAVRAALLEQTVPGQLMLNELSSKVLSSKNTDSENLDNFSPVEIKAEYVSDGRNDLLMEEIVMRMRSKVRVTAIKWEVVTEDTD